jgi:hypothetical protein
VISGFTAVIDPAAVGWTTEAFIELFCTGRTTPAQIAAATRRHPEVVGAYTVSGEADALVHLRAADIAHLEQALERLRAEPFVTSTRSMIVLSRLLDASGAAAAPRPVATRPEQAKRSYAAPAYKYMPVLASSVFARSGVGWREASASASAKNRRPPNSPCSRSSNSSARPVMTCNASIR